MIDNNDIDCIVCENKAHEMLGFTKRTCHFISDTRKRRSLYLCSIRSNFEFASIIWRPTTETAINEFEQLQKKSTKVDTEREKFAL